MWLAAVGREQRRRLTGASLILACDALAAVGFAAGLAKALSVAHQGLGAAAPWLLLLITAALMRSAIAHLSAREAGKAAAAIKTCVRAKALRSLLRGCGQSGGQGLGALMTTAIDGVENLDAYFTRFLPARRASLCAPLMILAAIAMVSPISAGLLLAALAPFCVGMALAGVAAAQEGRKQFQALGRLSGLFLDRVRALPVILAFQAEAQQTTALAHAAEDLRRRTARVLRRAFLSSAVLEAFTALSVALVAIYWGLGLLHVLPHPASDAMDLWRAIFVLVLAPEVYAPLRRLSAAYHDRQAAEAAAAALGEIETPPAPQQVVTISKPPTLRFEAVGITHPHAEGAVIEHFNLAVPSGAIVALMGASGSGKTSLLHLLLGLARLTQGEVWIDDQRLSRLGGIAEAVAWAGQSPLIVPGTIAENLALAHRSASRDEVAAAAARVGLGGAIARRGAGLDARLDERGGGLSGGERRRLALGRALLKGAPILLLDEPTANLDDAAEQSLLPVIAEACRGHTVIIATHSHAVAQLADVVVVL
jgi:ATP-binding cassette subfamily C protein CydD